MMPEMDGLTATREIRCMNRKDMQTVPIIALTANAFVNDRNAAMEAGMNGYVTKPIDVDALLKEIEEVFKKLAGN
jgi:CheY-like chemotaxis protein